MRLFVLACLLLGACGDQAPPTAATPVAPQPAPPQGLLTIDHDFGLIPHGETRHQEFVLDLDRIGEPVVPMRVHIDCSCGHADLRFRGADGRERFPDGSGDVRNRPAPGETAVLRIEIDTKKKEPIDVAKTTSRGFVVLQPVTDDTGLGRLQWPFVIRFGIEAPFVLRPLAALDFGRVPLAGKGSLTTTLRGDERHRDAQFGPVTCTDPAVAVQLEAKDDHWLLHAVCTPGELGNHRAFVTIGNTVPGYVLELAATWKVVPDLEATPMPKISFRAGLQREQTAAEAAGQFVLVTDHDLRRSSEFHVHKVVDGDGRDLSSHFATTLVAVPDQPRQHRLCVRYVGGLTQGLRGSIVLTKNGAEGPFLPIELVVFAHKDA